MKPFSGAMLKFFYKIILPSFLAVLLFVITLFYIVIPVFEQAMMDRKREMIRELTNSASSILDKYHKEQQEGFITMEEAQQIAISRIQYLRYGEENKDYFWITDMHPTMIMHPYVPELNGTDLTDYEDSHGKKMFVEFVNAVQDDGHGFVEYMWQWKDDSTHVVPKLSYVKTFEPWGWIIGTGIYIEDVRKEISSLSSRLLYISIIIALITALILTFISLQSFRIERKRQAAENDLKESREKYRSLVEASTEGLLMISENEIIFANSVFLELAGISFEEISKMNWQNIFNLPDQISQKLQQGSHDVETPPFETNIELPGKRKADVLIHITPILFYGRKAVIFSIKDISSDIQMKQQLHESRERFKTLMDKLNVGIFRTTMDSRGRFVEANHTALKLLGYTDDEQLKNKYILDFFADSDDKRNFRKNLLQKGFIKNQILKLLKTDGSSLQLMVSLAVITGEDGKASFCDGIIEPFSSTIRSVRDSIKPMNTEELRSILHSVTIQSFIQPIQTIHTDSEIAEAFLLMEELQTKVLFVKDDQERLLGYLTHKELASAVSKTKQPSNLKVFRAMSAPIQYLNDNATVIAAKSLLKKSRNPVFIVLDSAGQISGYIHQSNLDTVNELRLCMLFEEMSEAYSIDKLRQLRSELINHTARLAANNIAAIIILNLLSEAFDVITTRLFELAHQELGNPPVEYAFIVMGSEGRHEQTLKTDQDNAIIFLDSELNKEEVTSYFLKLGKWMVHALHQTGYALCKGDNMASNPLWNQPLSVWKSYFRKWINTGQPKDLLDINIFFDFRFCHGNSKITDELEEFILNESKSNPAFLHHLAKNAMQFKPSVNLFGNVQMGSSGAPADTLRIKDSISAIVNFARIYALQHGINSKNTLSRLEELRISDLINEAEIKEIIRVLNYLTDIRIRHQSSKILDNQEADNLLNVKLLTDFDQTMLKKSLTTINDMMSRLTIDFKLQQ
jgi:PAS domain S-box-containing protein